MNDRRGFMGGVLACLAGAGVAEADVTQVKEIHAGGKPTIVLELDEAGMVPDQETYDKLTGKLRKLFPDCQVVVIPSYMKLSLLPTHGVYHREKLGNYEREIWAANEEDMKARLAYLDHDPRRK